MPKYIEGLAYHIYNRGAHRAPIFFTPGNYRYCLRLIFKYTLKYCVSLLGYCLMPNHYHLVLAKETGGSISRCVQTIFNAYVQGFNKVHRHSGTLFQGEAKSRLVETDDYAVELIRYIHLNPVRAGLARKVSEWEYSDYWDWINNSGPVSSKNFRQQFFADGNSYKEYVAEYLDERDKISVAKYLIGL